jgi:hypothetical protein
MAKARTKSRRGKTTTGGVSKTRPGTKTVNKKRK